MGNNELENGRGEGRLLGERLTGTVKATINTMIEKGIPDGATVGRLKGVFPQVRDRDIDRILGKSSKRMGTIVIPRDSIVRLVVNVDNPSQIGNKPFGKALDSAIRDESKRRAETQRIARNARGNQSNVSSGRR